MQKRETFSIKMEDLVNMEERLLAPTQETGVALPQTCFQGTS